jgi:hypothetical protein
MITAAGIILRAPNGTVLLLRRDKSQANFPRSWDLPGGELLPGEDAATGAARTCTASLGWSPGSAGKWHCRSLKGGRDYTAYLKDVEREFTPPKLGAGWDSWRWIDPVEALGGAP